MADYDEIYARVVCEGQHGNDCRQCKLYHYLKSIPEHVRLVCGGGPCTGRCRNFEECTALNEYVGIKNRQLQSAGLSQSP